MTVRESEATIRGLSTAWLEAGSDTAPILMLFHGFPDTAETWRHQIEAFQDRFHVIAPFARGVARSAGSPSLERYGPDASLLDHMAILDQIDPTGERPVYTVGHDLGAVHAWRLARHLGSRHRGLVIINGLTIGQMLKRLRSPRQLGKSWYMFFFQVPKLPELLARSLPETARFIAYRLGGMGLAEQPPGDGDPRFVADALRQYRAFLRAALTEVRRPGPRLNSPVLVLWAAQDAFLVPPKPAEFAPVARQATIRILPGGHWLHWQMPDKINTLIGDFFTARSLA